MSAVYEHYQPDRHVFRGSSFKSYTLSARSYYARRCHCARTIYPQQARALPEQE
ncbi:hypothetical protein NKV53_03390 [Legionella sp. 27cVA30]|uniref:hypothetical protein n=1 Tax=Legionella TaxID=445 RepID=UPI0013157C4C|nr:MULTISPECIES: hypothetical protein [Legionella]MCP0913409.1 hypothetical protein [Legionella sp. 27cVA30]